MTRAAGERGGIAFVTLTASLLLAAVAVLIATAAASVGEAAARARTAADAAALAGAAASPLVGGPGDDPCRHATDLSAANGAGLRACRAGPARKWPGTVVRVTVSVEPRLRLPGLPTRVEARAAAAVRPAATDAPSAGAH